MPVRKKKKSEIVNQVKKLGAYLKTIHGNKDR